MSTPRRLHRAATLVLSLALVGLGTAIVVVTVIEGGGARSRGLLLGVLFVAAGAARLYLQARTRDG